MFPRHLRRAEASAYLKDRWGLSYKPATLAKLAVIGGGPKFQHFGRIPIYTTESLDNWVCARLSGPKASTSDNGPEDRPNCPATLGPIDAEGMP